MFAKSATKEDVTQDAYGFMRRMDTPRWGNVCGRNKESRLERWYEQRKWRMDRARIGVVGFFGAGNSVVTIRFRRGFPVSGEREVQALACASVERQEAPVLVTRTVKWSDEIRI